MAGWSFRPLLLFIADHRSIYPSLTGNFAERVSGLALEILDWPSKFARDLQKKKMMTSWSGR